MHVNERIRWHKQVTKLARAFWANTIGGRVLLTHENWRVFRSPIRETVDSAQSAKIEFASSLPVCFRCPDQARQRPIGTHKQLFIKLYEIRDWSGCWTSSISHINAHKATFLSHLIVVDDRVKIVLEQTNLKSYSFIIFCILFCSQRKRCFR